MQLSWITVLVVLFVIMSGYEGTTKSSPSSGENSSTTISWNHLVGKTGIEAQHSIIERTSQFVVSQSHLKKSGASS